ncbi:MAG: serine/threonine protein kinase [Candidatus Krumholzibacteriota bacterium]|nr:serine/threonine protein kinase [Candidatus Krumholzibacteriota bacterium]
MENRNYQILNTIATGGTSVLYKAIQKSLDREVVIKKLHSHLTSDRNFTGRFELEAKSAASLDHENIVRIIDTGTAGNSYYIVMEYINGSTLKEVLEKNGPLGNDLTLLIAREICLGLDHAHQRGIIHRDIKPANIMITNEGQVKITDFGLVKLSQAHLEQTIADTLLGTPLYMSPEQAIGEGVDGRSDLFSLGTICYEMATGHQPFSGANYAAVIQNIINSSIKAPSKIRSSISPEVESIVMKALNREPSKRYGTALDMAREIETIIGREKIIEAKNILKRLVAGRPKLPETKVKKKRNKTKRKKILSTFMIAAALAVSSFYLYSNPDLLSKARESIYEFTGRLRKHDAQGVLPASLPPGIGIDGIYSTIADTSAVIIQGQPVPAETVYIEVPVSPLPSTFTAADSASPLQEAAAEIQEPAGTDELVSKIEEPADPREEETAGFIDIIVEPEADIVIDGIFRLSGNRYGPSEIEAGTHSISCKQKDFTEYTETIIITRGELSRRRIYLEMKSGDLLFATAAGIRVFINGKFMGITPLAGKISLPTGKHLIDLKKTGYKDWSNEVYIPADETVTMRIDMVSL